MKSLYQYRSYIKAVLFSLIVAVAIDTAIHANDLRRGFNDSQEKVQEIVHTDTILNATKKAVSAPTSLLRVLFSGR